MSRGTIGGQRLPAPMELGKKRSNIIRTLPVKAGESVAAGDVVDVVSGAVTTGKVQLGTLAVGSTIALNVDGAPREWIVVHHGKPSSIYSSTFTGGTILLMKDAYETLRWNSSSSNDYAKSTIHSYLNSTFLNRFDAEVRAAIKQVKLPYRPGRDSDEGFPDKTVASGENGLAAKVWLLSGYELGWISSGGNPDSYLPEDGAPLAYRSRTAKLNGAAIAWWLRSPVARRGGGSAFRSETNGSLGTDSVASTYPAVRPAMVLPDSVVVRAGGNDYSQAIALQAGSGGQSIDILYDGVAELAGVTAGTSIESPGVRGYAPMDGVLWARPEWENDMGVRAVYGSFVGDQVSPRTFYLGFRPDIVLLVRVDGMMGDHDNGAFTTYGGLAVSGSPAVRTANGTPTDQFVEVTEDGFRLTTRSTMGNSALPNSSSYIYNYIAFKG